jgi:hypothetical protein
MYVSHNIWKKNRSTLSVHIAFIRAAPSPKAPDRLYCRIADLALSFGSRQNRQPHHHRPNPIDNHLPPSIRQRPNFLPQDCISLNAEQIVWDHVVTVNKDLPPHSWVRRHQIILLPSTEVLPVSTKGEVVVSTVETMFVQQIEKVYLYFFNIFKNIYIFLFCHYSQD